VTKSIGSDVPPAETDGPAAATGVLPRRLGFVALTFLIVAWNAPIAAMAGFQQLAVGFGNGIGAPLSFIVAGLVLLVFAVGFIGMTPHVKNPGAFYCYIVDGLGKAPGLGGAFVATTAYLLFAAGAYVYLGLIVVDATERLFGAPVGNWQLWAFVMLVLITGLGLLRIDMSMKVIGVLVVVECAIVALWELAVLIQGGPEGYSRDTFTLGAFTSGPVGIGILFAMLCMIGFEGGACFRDETKDPEKTVRRATYSAIGLMTVLAAIGCWVYIISTGPSTVVEASLADPVGSFFTSIETYLGNVFVHLVTIILVTSQAASIISVQGNGSRYLFALGRDKVLSQRLASVHPKLQSPHVAVLTLAAVSLVVLIGIVLSGVDAVQAYATLTGSGIYFMLPLLIVTSISIAVFFRRHPEANPGIWVSTVAPITAALALTILFVLCTQNLTVLTVTPAGALIAEVGLVIAAALGVLLALRYKRSRPDVYGSIGNQ
jgi:amino acid transporter